MRSYLEQLRGDDDAVLLLHAAGELSGDDRMALEQRLRDEPALRRRAEELAGAYACAMNMLPEQYASGGASAMEAASVRRAMRSVESWRKAREESANAAAARAARAAQSLRDMRFPWWSYPLAAAAVVTLGFLVWWRSLPDPEVRSPIVLERPAFPAVIGAERQNLVEDTGSANIAQFASIDSLDEIPGTSTIQRELETLRMLPGPWQ